jgi:hypothetical protein
MTGACSSRGRRLSDGLGARLRRTVLPRVAGPQRPHATISRPPPSPRPAWRSPSGGDGALGSASRRNGGCGHATPSRARIRTERNHRLSRYYTSNEAGQTKPTHGRQGQSSSAPVERSMPARSGIDRQGLRRHSSRAGGGVTRDEVSLGECLRGATHLFPRPARLPPRIMAPMPTRSRS